MLQTTIQRLQFLCSTIPDLLATIPEPEFVYKPAPNKWSKKEILGHLIDSAANNHQRFVRVQFEDVPAIFYDQDKWNDHSYHNQAKSRLLIYFWAIYNRHLAELIKLIPEEKLKRECYTGEEKKVTLQWLIEDYVNHLEHHLKQIVDYE